MISVDTPEDNKGFADQEQANFPILSDPGRKVADAYGVIPSGRQFASRWTFYISPEGKIAFVDKQVSPATAGQSLVAKLNELGVPERR
jgi:thioredoxin-dependent peroxiredoxin